MFPLTSILILNITRLFDTTQSSPHVAIPQSPIALESSSQSEMTAIPCINLSNSWNAHPQGIGLSYRSNLMEAWQSMNIMQGRISFKFQDLPERWLGSRSYHGLFGDLGRSYSRVIAANELTHVHLTHIELSWGGDKKKKLIGGEGETFPYCPF
jgi:hypothetical protein